MFCEQVEPIVHELAPQYAGRMQFHVVAHDAPGSQDRIRRYGLSVHGMVITDRDDKVVWSESGHKQTRAGVVAAVDKVLGG